MRMTWQTKRVLALLLDAPQVWRHGYDISQRTGLKSGTLYPLLMRLHDRGFLEARWQGADRPGRPPRHAYRLTGEGRRLANEVAAREAPSFAAPKVSGVRL